MSALIQTRMESELYTHISKLQEEVDLLMKERRYILDLLENCSGNINQERGFHDELQSEIEAAISMLKAETK